MTAEDELLSNHETPKARFGTETDPGRTARETSAAMQAVDLSELIGAGDAPHSAGTGLSFGSQAAPTATADAAPAPAITARETTTPATAAPAAARRGLLARLFAWLLGRG